VASTSASTEAVDARHQGVASGLLNTSAQVGTTLGLAVIVPLAAAEADYRLGFTLAAAGAVGGAGLFAFRLPGEQLVPRARLRRRYQRLPGEQLVPRARLRRRYQRLPGDVASARPAASSGSRRPARSSRAQCG
jgi:MFS family permease